MRLRSIAVLDAPCNLGLQPPAPGREPGVRRLPEALRAHRLVERLNAADAGRVPPPAYSPAIEPASGVRNGLALAAYTRDLAAAVGASLDRGQLPLVLGGDCSVLLGGLLALRRRDRYGLLFLDGHQDLLTPSTSASRGAAGMDLALACGVGPALLTTFEGLTPLVHPADVVMLGDRSGDGEYPDPLIRPVRAAMQRVDLAAWRRQGIGSVTRSALERLRASGVRGVWVHLDADVLDDAVMPAVDSRQPGGLTCAELGEALEAVFTSGVAVGMEVTILDPDLDPEGQGARALVEVLVKTLGAAAEPSASLAPA